MAEAELGASLGATSRGGASENVSGMDRARRSQENYVDVKPLAIPSVELAGEFRDTKDAVAFLYQYIGIVNVLCPEAASCIVLDIDGTILLNKSEETFAVAAIRDLSVSCAERGIAIFVVTARPDSNSGENRRWTERQLKKCGIPEPARIFMRPEGEDYAEYKLRAREEIRRTHRIIVSCGDQFPDFTIAPPKNVSDGAIIVAFMGDLNGSLALKLPAEN